MSRLDVIVDHILPHVESGAQSARRLRQVLGRLHGYTDREIDRALQKARREGLIEYSKLQGVGDTCKLWRLVERKPARKVGRAVAEAACNGEAVDHIADLHQQVKSNIDEAHDRGFKDGQQHAFQSVAERLRAFIENGVELGLVPSLDDLNEMADEIEAGAWASDRDKS